MELLHWGEQRTADRERHLEGIKQKFLTWITVVRVFRSLSRSFLTWITVALASGGFDVAFCIRDFIIDKY
jgi:hypothetical protein